MRTDLAAYLAQSDVLHRACAGLTAGELIAPPPREPGSGAWTIKQVVVHMYHSDLAATHRMLRIACEPRPLLIAYDETAHADHLAYHEVDLATVCELFRLGRHHTHEILSRLPDEAFGRVGVHNQRGVVTLAGMVAGYVEHVDHHMRFVAKKRAALGKPLPA